MQGVEMRRVGPQHGIVAGPRLTQTASPMQGDTLLECGFELCIRRF
jgi:hypothetical protein